MSPQSQIEENDNEVSYNTIFLSDLHLGSKPAQADLLLDFLKHNTAKKNILGWRYR